MTGEKRRSYIIEALSDATAPINATVFAEKLGVTRQIIVADIALLRASGYAVRAEHKGYVLDKPEQALTKKIVCKHSKEGVTDEFYTIVDNGGKVLDVQVEHSIYSTISAELSISSRYDADEFIRLSNETGASQLSDLTDGVHIHTISIRDEEMFDRICKKLDELGILVKD